MAFGIMFRTVMITEQTVPIGQPAVMAIEMILKRATSWYYCCHYDYRSRALEIKIVPKIFISALYYTEQDICRHSLFYCRQREWSPPLVFPRLDRKSERDTEREIGKDRGLRIIIIIIIIICVRARPSHIKSNCFFFFFCSPPFTFPSSSSFDKL